MSDDAADLLRAAAGRRFVDEDGQETKLELLPPLSAAELEALEALLPCPLPDDARALLSVARGVDGVPLESVDFSGLGEPIMEDLFPCGLPIAHDGFGNYWVLDLTSSSTLWGPVFYLCHDPAVVVYQCDDVRAFIEEMLRLTDPAEEDAIDRVHEQHAFEIWRTHPGAMSRDAALQAGDATLRDFAASLTPDHYVIDLRNAHTGDGFAWGRFGPQTPLRRAGESRIFAYQTVSRWRRLKVALVGR